MNPYPRTWIEIDLASLAHNLGLVRERIGHHAKIALVAKADAYGHGLVPIARFAVRNGADWIAVATVQEGIALRDAGMSCPIIVLSPILNVEADQAVFYDLITMVEHLDLARALGQAAVTQSKTAVVHIPVDTGVNRFGCTVAEAAKLLGELRAIDGIRVEGIGTHFADSGQNPDRTRAQMGEFAALLATIDQSELLVHVANSAGATLYDDLRFDLVRIGIAAYGVDPYGMFGGRARPVLSWRARVMSMRERPAGTSVSYSGTHVLTRESRIATLGVGYGDGYPRSLSNRGFVMFGERRAPVVGLVCMDQILVDVTDLPEVGLGAEADLIGSEASVETLSQLANTNVHEIVTRIMSRVPRRYRQP
ncbi:MAG: alanine racemase [Chthonomonas sp.]|nr:alanine racemase [Chthonomonas sp.]